MATRICILTSAHTVNDTRIFHREAKTLAQAGYQTVLAGIGTNHVKSAPHLAAVKNPVAIHQFPAPGSRIKRFIFSLPRYLRFALRIRADIYHLHDPELLPLALILKILNRRVVCDIHEDYYRQIPDKRYVPRPFRTLLASLYNNWEKFVARHIDGVVTATDTIAQRLSSSARHLVTVKNYPEPFPSHQPAPSHYAQSAPNGPFRIVHLARILTPERGITLLLDALAQLPDCELLLAGKFSPSSYENEIKNHPAYPRVRHLGVIPHPDCFRWYATSNVGVVPSLPVLGYEFALPVKMFEFMSAGLPVIVPDFPPLRAIIKECACGLTFSPGDATSLADALRTIKFHPEQARKMGKNGQDAVNKIYNWSNEEKKLLKFYERII